MILNVGQQHSNQKGSPGAKNSRRSDSSSFDEMLNRAGQSKKKKSTKAKTPLAAKKKPSNVQDRDDQPHQKLERRSVAKAKANNKRAIVPSENTTKRQPTENNIKTMKQVQAEEGIQQVNKKFVGNNVQNQEMADSIKLSALQNKTLEKNQISQENSFEQMMSQMKQAMVAQQATGKTAGVQKQAMATPLAPTAGKMKIPTEMKLNQNLETLNMSDQSVAKAVQSLEQATDGARQEDVMSHLNSLIAQQGVENESGPQDINNSAFAKELNNAENQNGESKIENMNSIIKQARTFIKDGGGEMQIHLQPEGLGKVQLKVAVENGQVNVEMLTDNTHAKKALEEGLFDVKQALEGQKLVVDTLKVEMGQDYHKDFSDLRDHAREQANRDFAEQFLGQFRQQREEKFGGMFDAFRGFQPGQTEPELRLNSRNPYTTEGKGRSVNLVA